MTGHRVTSPRSYFLGAAALIAVGLVLGLGLSIGLDLPRASNAAATAQLRATTNSAPIPESPFVVGRGQGAAGRGVHRRHAQGGRGLAGFRRRVHAPLLRLADAAPAARALVGLGLHHRQVRPHHDEQPRRARCREHQGHAERRRVFKAVTVGTDPATDVAVIKIEGPNLPVLPIGDSEKLRIGDWAIAIGNPLGDLRGSVTVGIISAQGRSNLNIFGGTPDYQDFIQTDASINFGNSGGPLCNIRGEVIGINTAINTNGQGIGFAIPINLAKHVAEQLVAHGTVKRAMMGVTLAQLTPELAEGFGIANQQGVVVQSVNKDSPAERAGLQRNDIIVEMNGQTVIDRDKFRLKIADTPAGSKVKLGVLRDGKRDLVEVTLTDRDEFLATNRAPGAGVGRDRRTRPERARPDREREERVQPRLGRARDRGGRGQRGAGQGHPGQRRDRGGQSRAGRELPRVPRRGPKVTQGRQARRADRQSQRRDPVRDAEARQIAPQAVEESKTWTGGDRVRLPSRHGRRKGAGLAQTDRGCRSAAPWRLWPPWPCC
jgi:hypothetical protein